MQNIPTLLKSKRIEHGVNLTDMGKRMGKSKQHIRQIESVNANLTVRTITNYLAALSLNCELEVFNKNYNV